MFASIQHDELAGTDLTLWIDLLTVNSFPVAIMPSRLIVGAAAGQQIRHGTPAPFLMRPGDRLRGRASPATGVGIALTIRFLFIDLPVGEYILQR